ncbi:MAG: peptidylprolyl isomerase [Spirochaetota bacterium]
MKKKLLLIAAVISAACSASFAGETAAPVNEWEPYNRVVAVVNNKPIIESDFNGRFETAYRKKGKTQTKSLVLDQIISEALLDQTAEAEAIQVTEERLDKEIQKMMERSGIKDPEVFRKKLEADQGMDIQQFRREIRKQIIIEQIIMVVVELSPPSAKEIKAWYDKNRQQLVQIKMKHILIRPKGSGFAAEKAANEKIKELQRRILAGESFDDIARKESEDPVSAAKGGDLGWAMLAEMDPYFASQAMQMYAPGKVSGVIKSSFGYHLVKFYDRRNAPYEEVSDRISNMLGNQNRMAAFDKWMLRARKESEVKVYLEGYTPPQG